MTATIQLRCARASDADELLAWRNDTATRAASRQSQIVPREDHQRWLANCLADCRTDLLVAEWDGMAIGTVRCERDSEGRSAELSWTLAPAWRGRGLGTAMLCAAVARYGAVALRAVIHRDNHASMRMAVRAGFRCVAAADDHAPWSHWLYEPHGPEADR